jgi:hypothetical protein
MLGGVGSWSSCLPVVRPFAAARRLAGLLRGASRRRAERCEANDAVGVLWHLAVEGAVLDPQLHNPGGLG